MLKDKLTTKQRWWAWHKKNPKVCDIGCGNARILNSISNHSKYLGIDICEDLISFCETNFKNDNKSSFLAMDIEKYRWPKKLKEYDVAYLDSTFTMMENPQFLLLFEPRG